MIAKPRKEADQARRRIEAALMSSCGFSPADRDRVRRIIENTAIRPVADPLEKALEYCEEQIGWKGDRGQDSDRYACEHCNGPPELDFRDLQHEPHCPVSTIRAALANYRGEGK